MKLAYSFDQPVKGVIDGLVTKKSKLSGWWATMPDWYCSTELTDETKQHAEKQKYWGRAQHFIEDAA